MTLWSGYYMNRIDAMPDPITDTIPIFNVNPNQEPTTETKTAAGTYGMFGPGSAYVAANGFVLMEQFGAGTMTFMYYFDEWHWIVKGEGEMLYNLSSEREQPKKRVALKTGDFVVTPRGSIVDWIAPPGGMLRRYCGMMPGYALHPRLVEPMTAEMKRMNVEINAVTEILPVGGK